MNPHILFDAYVLVTVICIEDNLKPLHDYENCTAVRLLLRYDL